MKEKILDSIETEGFYFSHFKGKPSLLESLLSLKEPTSDLEEQVTQLLNEFDLFPAKLHLVFEDLKINESHVLHTHLTPCDFQILIWAADKPYEGRNFLYGTLTEIKSFHPSFGDICFMKTNDLKYIHGVDELLTDTTVRTLLISFNYSGKKGEHLTVTANDLNPI